MTASLVRLARPHHWIKNIFVVIPVPFAVCTGAEPDVAALLLGLVGFCLVNSAVYTFNDLFDAEADRLHPAKRNRPIAAGQVSAAAAAVASGVLFLLGLAVCLAAAAVSPPVATQYVLLLVLAYTGINLAYSLGGKRVLLLDVFMLSSGFVIRVLLGCALVDAVPSSWLLLCTSSLALFLGFAKREADMVVQPDAEADARRDGPAPSGRYNKRFLDQATVICAAVAVLAYALYCIESGVLAAGREMASIPFVAYGVLNYLLLAQSGGGSPVEVAFTSRSSQICAAGWIVAVLWSLGLVG